MIQRARPRRVSRRAPRSSSRLVALLLASTAACSSFGADDTFIQFTLEGETYEVTDAEFIAWGSGPTRFMLVRNIAAGGRRTPDVNVQWVMQTNVQELAGRTLDLMDEQLNPLAQIRPSEEVGVQPTAFRAAGSSFQITISRVADGYVEGSFTGANLSHVHDDESVPIRLVSADGHFRARLVIRG